jgi:hypothetical protein
MCAASPAVAATSPPPLLLSKLRQPVVPWVQSGPAPSPARRTPAVTGRAERRSTPSMDCKGVGQSSSASNSTVKTGLSPTATAAAVGLTQQQEADTDRDKKERPRFSTPTVLVSKFVLQIGVAFDYTLLSWRFNRFANCSGTLFVVNFLQLWRSRKLEMALRLPSTIWSTVPSS